MGGNAFPVTAKRLTTLQLSELKGHAQTAVAPFFTRVAPLRDCKDKSDHGDLDLICGWDHKLAWNWKGEDRGVIGGGNGMGGTIKVGDEAEARVEKEGESEEDKEKRELRAWCFDIARAVQAKEWARRGPEISLAIPCSVFGEATKEYAGDPDAFFQLDLPLVPIFSLDFYLLVSSYSTTFLILARALRCISAALTLQMTGLIIRHPAYPGIPGIDLRLTSSAQELCTYFGLSLSKWEEGFGSEADVWEWLVTVEEGGKLEDAYKRMVRPKSVRQKGHKNKAGALDAFVDFLKGTKYGEDWDGSRKKKEEAATEAERSITPLPTETSPADTPVPPLSPSTMTTMSTSPPITPHSTVFTPPADMLDPDKPVPLDARAEAALERWNKKEAYQALLEERRGVAAVLVASQKKRIESKLKSLEEARRKQEEDEENGISGSLAAAVEAMRVTEAVEAQ